MNFIQGIFATLEDASRAVHDHIKNRTVASQYSRTGIYEIQEIEYERIDEDRIIIESHVFDNNFFENENLYPSGEWYKPIPLEQL